MLVDTTVSFLKVGFIVSPMFTFRVRHPMSMGISVKNSLPHLF